MQPSAPPNSPIRESTLSQFPATGITSPKHIGQIALSAQISALAAQQKSNDAEPDFSLLPAVNWIPPSSNNSVIITSVFKESCLSKPQNPSHHDNKKAAYNIVAKQLAALSTALGTLGFRVKWNSLPESVKEKFFDYFRPNVRHTVPELASNLKVIVNILFRSHLIDNEMLTNPTKLDQLLKNLCKNLDNVSLSFWFLKGIHQLLLKKDPSHIGAAKTLMNVPIYQKLAPFPQLLPRLVDIIKENAGLFVRLCQVQHHFSGDDLAYLIERYVFDYRKTDSSYGSSFPDLDAKMKQISTNPESLQSFKRIIGIERAHCAFLLPLLAKYDFLCAPDVLAMIESHPQFARQLAALLSWEGFEPAEKVFTATILDNPKAVLELFSIVGDMTHVLVSFFLPEPHLHEDIKLLRELSETQQRGFCAIRYQSQLLYNVISKASPPLRNKLLLLAQSGDIAGLEKLYQCAADKNSAIGKRLLAQASPITMPIVRKILSLLHENKHDRTLLAFIEQSKPEDPFTSELCGLLSLHSQGQYELMERGIAIALKPESYEDRQVLSWIAAGRFRLAEGCLPKVKEKYWEVLIYCSDSIADRKTYNNVCQMFCDLHHSLKALNLLDPKDNEYHPLEVFAFSVLRHKGPMKVMEWISVLQFKLQYQFSEINSMLVSNEWEAFKSQKTFLDEHTVDNLLNTFPSSYNQVIRSINANPTWRNHLQSYADVKDYTRILAKALLTNAGTINIPLIPILRQAFPYEDALENRHIEHVLSVIQSDVYFSDRLPLAVAPQFSPSGANLVRSTAGTELYMPVTDQDARQAVLCSLLWPIRQSVAGSCFSTAAIIQQNSVNGLKQRFEDFIFLANAGNIQRPIPGNPAVIKQYPMTYDRDRYYDVFANDNHMVRALEFTKASMAVEGFQRNLVTHGWYDRDKSVWNSLFMEGAQLFDSVLNEAERKAINWNDEQQTKLENLAKSAEGIKKHVTFCYFGHRTNHSAYDPKERNKVGAWVMVDGQMGLSVVESPQHWLGLVKKVVNQWFTLLRFSHFKKEQLCKLKHRIAPYLIENARSEKFISKLANREHDAKLNIFGTNAPECLPFISFEGGKSVDLVPKHDHSDENAFLKKMPPHHHPLGGILQSMRYLTAPERVEANINPNALKTIAFDLSSRNGGGHALNLCIGKLFRQVVSIGGSEILFKHWQEANSKMLATPHPSVATKELINLYFSEGDFKGHQETFEKHLAFTRPFPTTLGELCQHIIRYSALQQLRWDAKSKAEKQIDRILNRMTSIVLPPQFVLADTNYYNPSRIKYRTDLLSKHDGLNYDQDWPASLMNLTEFTPSDDDYSRQYYRPSLVLVEKYPVVKVSYRVSVCPPAISEASNGKNLKLL